MPDYQLTICGKIDGEFEFKRIYEKELALPNIRIAGFVDPGSSLFKDICEKNIALVYPSCAEGQAGSVVLAMHAGLIPLISRESGVDVAEFGTIFGQNTVEEIQKTVKALASSSVDTLRSRAIDTWLYAQEHHTREAFRSAYRSFVDRLLANHA
jgi:hypothetical protein